VERYESKVMQKSEYSGGECADLLLAIAVPTKKNSETALKVKIHKKEWRYALHS
jgi:hypothetical protein